MSDDLFKKPTKSQASQMFKPVRKVLDKMEDVATKEKQARIKKFRTEASRLASMANKRLKRLENAGLKDSPAYKKWLDEGGEKFAVRGKDYNQLQREMARMRNFINAETSTVRGVNSVLKTMANNTGIKYKNLAELRQSAGKFFELASKVEQYLRTVEDMASAIGYQKIWEAINQYVQKERIDLTNGQLNIEEMTQRIIDAMDIYNEADTLTVTGEGFIVSEWFVLDDD